MNSLPIRLLLMRLKSNRASLTKVVCTEAILLTRTSAQINPAISLGEDSCLH